MIPETNGPVDWIAAASRWQEETLASLHERFSGFDFWVVNRAYGGPLWCWRPKGSTDGRQSRNCGSPELAAATILGKQEEDRLLEAIGEVPSE